MAIPSQHRTFHCSGKSDSTTISRPTFQSISLPVLPVLPVDVTNVTAPGPALGREVDGQSHRMFCSLHLALYIYGSNGVCCRTFYARRANRPPSGPSRRGAEAMEDGGNGVQEWAAWGTVVYSRGFLLGAAAMLGSLRAACGPDTPGPARPRHPRYPRRLPPRCPRQRRRRRRSSRLWPGWGERVRDARRPHPERSRRANHHIR